MTTISIEPENATASYGLPSVSSLAFSFSASGWPSAGRSLFSLT